jgi:hypothetical protein
MKSLKTLALAVIFAALSVAQLNTLTQTTTTAAITNSGRVLSLTSVTGINVPSLSAGVTGTALYIIDPGSVGELVRVQSITGLLVTVSRAGANSARAHVSGALVLIGNPNWFSEIDPSGSCVTATIFATPRVNVINGSQWLCSTVSLSWVPGWQNPSQAVTATATVASAAGVIVPSGRLFSVSGTAAITGFTTPIGFSSGSFSVIPTGVFTWTAAGNIGVAGTAVVGRAIIWTWDASAAKWYPSYV